MAKSKIATAYVQVMPSMEGVAQKVSSYFGGAGKTSGASFGGSLIGTIKTALATAGIGQALKTTILEGANLQQSLGGINTLFKDSASEVIANAKQAYQTAGIQSVKDGSAYLMKSGDRMNGPINMNGQPLHGLNAPAEDDEAVNWGTVRTTSVSITLSAGSWTEDAAAGFIQTVIVEGLTDEKKAKAYPAWPDTMAEKLALSEETAKVRSCTRNGSSMIFECWEEMPTLDIPVVVEVYV